MVLILTKNKLLMGFIVLLILFVLIGGVSAANNATLGQDATNEINQKKFQLETMILS